MTTNHSFNIKNIPSSPCFLTKEVQKYRIENMKLRNDLLDKDNKLSIFQCKLNKAFDLISNTQNNRENSRNSISLQAFNTISNRKIDSDVFNNNINILNLNRSNEKYERIHDIYENHLKNKVVNKKFPTIRKIKDKDKDFSIERSKLFNKTLPQNSILKREAASFSKTLLPKLKNTVQINNNNLNPNKTDLNTTMNQMENLNEIDSINILKEENLRLKTKIEEMNISFSDSIKSLTEIISDRERKNKNYQLKISKINAELKRISKIVLVQNEVLCKYKLEKEKIEEKFEFYIKNIKEQVSILNKKGHYENYDKEKDKEKEKEKDSGFISICHMNSNHIDSIKEDSEIERELSCLNSSPIDQKPVNKFRKVIKSAVNNSEIKKESNAIYDERQVKHMQEYDDLYNDDINGIRISFNKVDNINIDYSIPFFISSGEKNDEEKILNFNNNKNIAVIEDKKEEDDVEVIGRFEDSVIKNKDMRLDYEITKLVKENNFDVIFNKLNE